MKIFKVADIKKVGLTDTEYYMIRDDIDALNKDNKSEAFAVYFFDCYYFVDDNVKEAIKKIVIYLAKKYQGTNSQCSIRGACGYVSLVLNCSCGGVMRLLKGISYNDSNIYIADTFGLDVLEIKK